MRRRNALCPKFSSCPFKSLNALFLASTALAGPAQAEEIVVNQTGPYTLDRATPISGGPRVIDITTDGEISLSLDDVIATSSVSNGVGVAVNTTDSANISLSVEDISTSGSGQAPGIIVNGGAGTATATITAGSVSTSGDSSDGIVVKPRGGTTTVNVASVTTTGAGSNGVVLNETNGGNQTVNAGLVNVSGAGAYGIRLFSMTGSSTVTATDVTVADGRGIYANGTTAATVTAQNVSTGGSYGIAIQAVATAGGPTSVTTTGTIQTSGSVGYGIYVHGGGKFSVSNSGDINTTGDGSVGILVTGGTGISVLNSGSITTSGGIAADGSTTLQSNGIWAVAAAAPIVIDNQGDITVSGPTASAILVESGAGATSFGASGGTGGAIGITNSGTIVANGADSRAIRVLGGGGNLTFANGGSITGAISIVTADTALTNGGTITGNIVTGAGNVTLNNSATISGNVTTGTGNATLTNGGTITGDLTIGAGTNILVNTGTITGKLTSGTGSDTLTSSGTITGIVATGAGSDIVTNSGTIGGIDLGDGDDQLVLTGAWTVKGIVIGGAGNDTLRISGPSLTAPTELASGSFAGFESTSFAGGAVAIDGTLTSTTTIQSGKVFGRAGSTLIGNVSVANGATFGTAGTVNGNVTVAGTLAPGASPGTMTVNGNVGLGAGSTTLFEFTPTISDQLLISGSLTIAPGATLTLTGTRPLTPGVTYDLIVANGGISGNFATINKPATIQGFLSQSGTRLSLLGTFLNDAGFSSQTNATIDYVNDVLIAGQASTALLAAVPSLLTATGSSNLAVFQQLSPEAYASAAQLGTEQALTVVEAARAQARMRPSGEGLFTFGQALTNHRRMDGDAVRGVSGARLETYGGLAGIGIGGEQGWIGAFVGYLDGRQSIAGLGTRTDANGIVAGVQAAWAIGPVRLDGLIAYSGGNSETRRTVLNTPLTSRYGLRSWIWDVRASYGQPLNDNWALRPSIGVTGVRTTRAAVMESGNSPFALSVEKYEKTRWFLDTELIIEGGQAEGAAFHPYVAIGIQSRLEGRDSLATASFVNVSPRYSVSGLEREETLATGRVGMSYDISERFSVFATYGGEFGEEMRHNGSLGLRLKL